MRPRSSTTLNFGVALAVGFILVGYEWPSLWLVYVFKPLATLLVLAIALQNRIRGKYAYARWIVVGLCFSLVGDIFLIWPNRYFLLGLLAFLLTHVAYLIAFTRDAKFPARVTVWIAYLIIAALCCAFLFPTLPSALRILAPLYALFLSTMAAQAMGRSLILKTNLSQRAAIGALFFLLSDLLLAFHRFRAALLYATLVILVSYYIGQWLIASSTAESVSRA
jgi:uncharacterized membrane protein YhhN